MYHYLCVFEVNLHFEVSWALRLGHPEVELSEWIPLRLTLATVWVQECLIPFQVFNLSSIFLFLSLTFCNIWHDHHCLENRIKLFGIVNQLVQLLILEIKREPKMIQWQDKLNRASYRSGFGLHNLRLRGIEVTFLFLLHTCLTFIEDERFLLLLRLISDITFGSLWFSCER